MTERIYVVKNNIPGIESKIEYVGESPEKAQEICDKNQSKRLPCFIQVWENESKSFVTRKLKNE